MSAKRSGPGAAEDLPEGFFDDAKMERHVVAVTSRVDTKLATDLKLELDKAMAEASARWATQQAEAVAQAVARTEQRGQLRLEQMSEGVRKRVEDAVAQRERELIDEDGKVREASVAAELREQMNTYRAAASEAARQWGSGNDDFEEAALAKTSTALQLAQQGAEAAGRLSLSEGVRTCAPSLRGMRTCAWQGPRDGRPPAAHLGLRLAPA